MHYTQVQSLEQIADWIKLEWLWFNSGTDYRSIFDAFYDTMIDNYFDDSYLTENDIDISDRQKINEIIYDKAVAKIDGFTFEPDDFGVLVEFKRANADNPAGTFAQSDAFDSDIIITNADVFKSWLQEFIKFIDSKPPYRHGYSNFNTYAKYKDVEFIYDLESGEHELSDYINCYIERMGKRTLENQEQEMQQEIDSSIYLDNIDDVLALLPKK